MNRFRVISGRRRHAFFARLRRIAEHALVVGRMWRLVMGFS